MKKINYISGEPGIGKTEWAVRRMADQIQKDRGLFLYVAPTVQLIVEVAERLRKECPKQHDRIREIHGEVTERGHVTSSILSILNDTTDAKGRRHKRLKSGSVLLMTHEAFMRMPSVPRSEKLELIFDESRKCIAKGRELQLATVAHQRALEHVLNLEQAEEDSSFFRIKAKPKARSLFREYVKLKGLKFNRRQLDGVLDMLEMAANPRVEVYLRYRGGSQDETDGKRSIRAFEVVLPSRIFEGFKRVNLLSAFFEDSQMYHLLTDKFIKMKNITKEVPNFKTRQPEILNRYRNVTLVALTPQQRALTLSNKDNIMLADTRRDLLDDLHELGLKTSPHFKHLRLCYVHPEEYEVSGMYAKAVKLLKENESDLVVDPLGWYLKQTHRAIKKWGKKNDKRPLLFLNAKEKKLLERVPDTLKYDFKFESTNVHGLNKYSEYNVVAFLAAINPSPDLIRFYKIVLPSYDYQMDHVADVCVQCVCRSSVRRAEAKEEVLVVVPDQRVGQLLQDRLAQMPGKDNSLAPKKNMIFLDRDFGSHGEDGMNIMTISQRVAKHRSKPYAKEARNLKLRFDRLKVKIRKADRSINVGPWQKQAQRMLIELNTLRLKASKAKKETP